MGKKSKTSENNQPVEKEPSAPKAAAHSHFSAFLITWLVFSIACGGGGFYLYQEIQLLKSKQEDTRSPLDGKIEYLEDKLTELEEQLSTLEQTIKTIASKASTETEIKEAPEQEKSEEPQLIEAEEKPVAEEDKEEESKDLDPEIENTPEEETVESSSNNTDEQDTAPLVSPSTALPSTLTSETRGDDQQKKINTTMIMVFELKELIEQERSYGHVIKSLIPELEDEQAKQYAQELLDYADKSYYQAKQINEDFSLLINDAIKLYREQQSDLSLAEKLSLRFSKLIQIRKIDTKEGEESNPEVEIAKAEKLLKAQKLQEAVSVIQAISDETGSVFDNWASNSLNYLNRQKALEQFYNYVTKHTLLGTSDVEEIGS
jgi:hypothetical protein